MSEPSQPGDIPSPDLFADSPLFREIQRVLLSSPGPVNWELARQVGIAMVSMEGTPDPSPSDEAGAELEQTVRVAELQISGLTGIPVPTAMAKPLAARKAEWIDANIAGLKDLVEPSASNMQAALAKMQSAEDETEADIELDQSDSPAMLVNPLMGSLSQLSPLLLGSQAGSVFGYLGSNVFGTYDIAVPRQDSETIMFVTGNIAQFEQNWDLVPVEFRQWIALHQVAHRFEFANPWTRAHFVSLLSDFASTLEVDVEGLQERLSGFDPANPEALQSMLEGEEALFGTILDDEQRIKLARIQAFMAASEGFADHVAHTIGRKLLTSYGQIDEAMRRHRETESGDPVFERLLGIDMKKEHYVLGRSFCDRVVEVAGEDLLAQMWESANALPSMPELSEPTLWMARTG